MAELAPDLDGTQDETPVNPEWAQYLLLVIFYGQFRSLQILNEKMQEETEEQVGCEGLCQMGDEEMGAGGQRRVRERMCCQGLHQAPSLINPLITATTWQP